MWMRHAAVLVGLIGTLPAAGAEEFRIDDIGAARNFAVAQLKPGAIAFSDQVDSAAAAAAPNLITFTDWARTRPVQKRFLALFPSYTEPPLGKVAKAETKADGGGEAKADAKPDAGPVTQKLYMYVAQARFMLDRAPGALDLAHYVTPQFLERIDPAIKHNVITAGDAHPLKEQQAAGNENPERPWCTGRATIICMQSSYRLEGKIPIGIMLVNKLRDTAKKIADHIDFESELSYLGPSDIDQAGLQELTALGTPVAGVLEQNVFYVNQILKFAKFYAVFQGHPNDANKTIVTAFMALAIEGGVLDKKREFENVPVLRNLVPAQVLMGKSSFNSGASISAGLPVYARNEIRTIAGLLEHDKGK
jgi:hypothetical protein